MKSIYLDPNAQEPSGDGPENCKHQNTVDPYGVADPEERVIWCADCGALLMPGGTVYVPKTFQHVFACPMCQQNPGKKRSIFIDGSWEYACSNCGFVPEGDISFGITNGKGVSLKAWNQGVWKIVTGDVVELRKRYKEALKNTQHLPSARNAIDNVLRKLEALRNIFRQRYGSDCREVQTIQGCYEGIANEYINIDSGE